MSDKNFLARWSQRKRQVAEEARKRAEPQPAPVEEPLDLSLLPDIEALTAESDIALFMQKGVPDTLRNAALRRMWALDRRFATTSATRWITPGIGTRPAGSRAAANSARASTRPKWSRRFSGTRPPTKM